VTSSRGHDAPDAQERDDLVQQFLDGELTPEQAGRAREILASDSGLRRQANAYRRIGDLIRQAALDQTSPERVDEAWRRVASGIREPAAPGSGPTRAWVWMGEVVSHRKRYWIPAAGALAALAAVLVLVLRAGPVTHVPIKIDATQAEMLRSRVTDISLNSASTLVMEVETAAGGTAAVLWVTGEDDEKDEGEPADGSSE
jgi:anti-sigma factor RsiW